MITSSVSPVLKIGFRFLGMWPNDSHYIYLLSFIINMLIIQYFQYLYIFDHLKISELSNLIDGLTETLEFSLTIFKLASLWLHRRVLYRVLTDMDNDWRECINIDQHLYMMTIKANISYSFCNGLLSFNIIATVLYFFGNNVIHFVFLTGNYNDTIRQLPIRIQLPFETQHIQSPIFEFITITIILHVMIHVSTMALINGLLLTLVLHVNGQVDIICKEFGNISKNTHLHGSSFGMLVERHNKIISFSENVEQLFSFIGLLQIVWNTLVICGLGFVLIISVYTENVFMLVKTIFAYLGIIIEAFIICFAGEYLIFKCESITKAVYEMLWYNMPSNQSKNVIMITMRSQKRLAITAEKMMDMSFETFTNIMKASTSYVSVLYTMY